MKKNERVTWLDTYYEGGYSYEDYNDEMLDGGHWTKVLRVDKEDVIRIIEE